MEKYITKNGIKYELRDEQYYPMLEISEQTNYEIGKYGHLHLDFIKKHRGGTYTTLLTEERTREVEELTEQVQVLQESNDSMRESLEDLKDELSELSEDKDNIHLEMSKYVGEEWELPEPPPLMSAKTYRTKIAQPLITKLKDVIRKLIVNVVEISKMWKQALNEKSRFAGRCRDLERENDSLRKDAKKFGIVRDKLGEDEVQSILQKATSRKRNYEAAVRSRRQNPSPR